MRAHSDSEALVTGPIEPEKLKLVSKKYAQQFVTDGYLVYRAILNKDVINDIKKTLKTKGIEKENEIKFCLEYSSNLLTKDITTKLIGICIGREKYSKLSREEKSQAYQFFQFLGENLKTTTGSDKGDDKKNKPAGK